MERTFVVEYVTPDNDKLKIVELGEITISKRGNADKQLVNKVKQIIKDFGNKHEEDFPMIYEWVHDTYEFLYDVEKVGDDVGWKKIMKFVKTNGVKMFVQYLDDKKLYAKYYQGCATYGLVISTEWSFINVRETESFESVDEKCARLEKRIAALEKQVKSQQKEIKRLNELQSWI